MPIITKETTFLGYRRENGRVGVRNHVIVLPLDDLSNSAAEAVAHNIKGTMAIPHPYGRLQFGADLDLHFRTLIGTGCNPNVAAVVVICIEDGWAKKVADGIARRPASRWSWLRHRRQHGDHDTIHARFSKAAQANTCSGPPKSCAGKNCPLKDLWVSNEVRRDRIRPRAAARIRLSATLSTNCYPLGKVTLCFGETTELTGGEQIWWPSAAASTDEVRNRNSMFMFDRYQAIIDQPPQDERPVRFSQPTKGNIEGGLTTIEEKALGNIQKIGKQVHGRRRDRQGGGADGDPGLWFMDSSSAAAEMVTLCAASGYVVHLFPTGQGNVIGNADSCR